MAEKLNTQSTPQTQAFVSTAIRVLGLGLSLLSGILLARLLGPAQFGVYTLALTLAGLAGVFVHGGLANLLVREVAKADGAGDRSLLSGVSRRAIQFVATSSALVIALLILGAPWLLRVFTELDPTSYALIAVLVPLNGALVVVAGKLRGLRLVVISNLLTQLLQKALVVVGLGLYFWYVLDINAQHALILQCLAISVSVVLGVLVLQRYWPRRVIGQPVYYTDAIWAKGLFAFSLLAGTSIINTRADIVMIGMFLHSSDLGVYGGAVRFADILAVGITVANTVAVPYLARAWAISDHKTFNRTMIRAALFAVAMTWPVALICILWGGSLLGFLLGEEYRGGGTALAVLAVGSMATSMLGVMGSALNCAGREWYVTSMVGIAACFNIGFNWLLIPRYGIAGAAVATVASGVLWQIMLFGPFLRGLSRERAIGTAS